MAKTSHNCFCGREPHDLSFDCPLRLYFPAHWVKLNKRCPGVWWGVKSRRPRWAVIALSQTHTAGPCEEHNEHQAHGWDARRVHGLAERAALMEPNHCEWNIDAPLPSIPSYRLDIFILKSPDASLNIGIETFKPFKFWINKRKFTRKSHSLKLTNQLQESETTMPMLLQKCVSIGFWFCVELGPSAVALLLFVFPTIVGKVFLL